MAKVRAIEEFVQDFATDASTRARSLIVSVFGDAIAVHGNSVWMGSLIAALEPLGLNSRQLRTAVFRLVNDDWLQSHKIGRRSFYGFTDTGLRHYATAARRLYRSSPPDWDGHWTLVITSLLCATARDELRRELSWLGFGQISSGVLAHPAIDAAALDETLHDMQVTDDVSTLKATARDVSSKKALRRLSEEAWDLESLESAYAEFCRRWVPLKKLIARKKRLDPEQAFQLRTIAIDQYRRILLSDTDLPPELLPARWSGHLARDVLIEVYRIVQAPAEIYLAQSLENESGPLGAADSNYRARFGGL